MKKSAVLPFRQNGTFYYKRACVQIDRSNYLTGIGFLRRALECEPGNREYMMDMADVYARIGCFEESNKILINIVRRGNASSECFFGMGCNFFTLRQFEAARDALAIYQRMEPYGEYYDAAEDMLADMDDYENIPLPLHQIETAAEGKRALDSGDYDNAVKLFKKILSQNSDLLFVRNNLSLTYYCQKKINLAIKEAEAVLREEPDNLHALCNLCIFYAEAGRKKASEKALKKALAVKPADEDDLFKICLTLLELGKDDAAADNLKTLLNQRPYDKKALHYYAVCRYNKGNYREALTVWDRVDRIDPESFIAAYCMRKAYEAMGGESHERMRYEYKLSDEEAYFRRESFFSMLKTDRAEAVHRFNTDASFRALAKWNLSFNEKPLRLATIRILGSIGGEHTEELLREFLLNPEADDEIKRETLTALRMIGAEEPYIALLSGAIVEVRLNVVECEFALTTGQQSVIDLAMADIPESYVENFPGGRDRLAFEVMRIWIAFLRGEYAVTGARMRVSTPKNWATALLIASFARNGVQIDRDQLIECFDTTKSAVSKCMTRLKKALAQLEKEDEEKDRPKNAD